MLSQKSGIFFLFELLKRYPYFNFSESEDTTTISSSNKSKTPFDGSDGDISLK